MPPHHVDTSTSVLAVAETTKKLLALQLARNSSHQQPFNDCLFVFTLSSGRSCRNCLVLYHILTLLLLLSLYL